MSSTPDFQIQNLDHISSRVPDLQPNLNERYTSIILLGPPGCGKGTQGRKISESLRVPLISSGDILRENIRQNTDLGKDAKRAVDRGELVRDGLILKMLRRRVLRTDCQAGFVLDGVPRTMRQAKFLDNQLYRLDGSRIPFIVLKLDLDDHILIKRMSGRRVCPYCGSIYNVETNPPFEADKCDRDGSKLAQRSDDTVEVSRKRVDEYRATLRPIASYLSARYDHFVEVDCDRPIHQMTSHILEVVRGQRPVRVV